MPIFEHTVEIKAEPERVFDLIARVEDFCHYTDMIKEIRATGPRTYHWKIGAAGMSLEWDAVVTECVRPKRFAWQSIRGIENGGSYVLEPSKNGTLVSLSLEYHLPSRLVERAVTRVADPLIRRVEAQVLGHVKARLENQADSFSEGIR